MGLGLSLVWEIVALHGGEIRVEESSEKGTTIVVKFPDRHENKVAEVIYETLIVIDMQNDFVTGVLGSKEAVAVLPNVIHCCRG